MTLGMRYIIELLFQSKQEIQFSRQETRKKLSEETKLMLMKRKTELRISFNENTPKWPLSCGSFIPHRRIKAPVLNMPCDLLW